MGNETDVSQGFCEFVMGNASTNVPRSTTKSPKAEMRGTNVLLAKIVQIKRFGQFKLKIGPIVTKVTGNGVGGLVRAVVVWACVVVAGVAGGAVVVATVLSFERNVREEIHLRRSENRTVGIVVVVLDNVDVVVVGLHPNPQQNDVL